MNEINIYKSYETLTGKNSSLIFKTSNLTQLENGNFIHTYYDDVGVYTQAFDESFSELSTLQFFTSSSPSSYYVVETPVNSTYQIYVDGVMFKFGSNGEFSVVDTLPTSNTSIFNYDYSAYINEEGSYSLGTDSAVILQNNETIRVMDSGYLAVLNDTGLSTSFHALSFAQTYSPIITTGGNNAFIILDQGSWPSTFEFIYYNGTLTQSIVVDSAKHTYDHRIVELDNGNIAVTYKTEVETGSWFTGISTEYYLNTKIYSSGMGELLNSNAYTVDDFPGNQSFTLGTTPDKTVALGNGTFAIFHNNSVLVFNESGESIKTIHLDSSSLFSNDNGVIFSLDNNGNIKYELTIGDYVDNPIVDLDFDTIYGFTGLNQIIDPLSRTSDLSGDKLQINFVEAHGGTGASSYIYNDGDYFYYEADGSESVTFAVVDDNGGLVEKTLNVIDINHDHNSLYDDKDIVVDGAQVSVIDVLANDPTNSVIQYVASARGDVTINTDGTINYKPKLDDYYGADTIYYSAQKEDGTMYVAHAYVSVDYPGGEYTIIASDTDNLIINRSEVTLKPLDNGGYVVVWEEYDTTLNAPLYNTKAIMATTFNADGSIGAENITIRDYSRTTTTSSEDPDTKMKIFSLDDGGFAILFYEYDTSYQILKVFDLNGVNTFSETVEYKEGNTFLYDSYVNPYYPYDVIVSEITLYTDDIVDSNTASYGLRISDMVEIYVDNRDPDTWVLGDLVFYIRTKDENNVVSIEAVHLLDKSEFVMIDDDFTFNPIQKIGDNNFLITFQNDETHDLLGITVDSRGNKTSDTFFIHTEYSYTEATALHDGGFLITWSKDNIVYAREFGQDSTPTTDVYKFSGVSPLDTISSFNLTTLLDGTVVYSHIKEGGSFSEQPEYIVGSTSVNFVPTKVDKTWDYRIDNEETFDMDILGKYSDGNNDSLRIEVMQPNNGAVIINADNTISYSFDSGYTGMDSIWYKIFDTKGGFIEDFINIKHIGEVVQNSIMMADLIVPIDKSLDFSFLKNGIDTGNELSVRAGAVKMNENVQDFDAIRLENILDYNMGIEIDDSVLMLKHVSGISTISGANLMSADINEDGMSNISDVVLILKHVSGVGSIDTFNMIDGNNNQITSIDMLNTAPEWSLIANGDINGSGGFI